MCTPQVGKGALDGLELELEEVWSDLEDLRDELLLTVTIVNKVQVHHRVVAVVLVPLEGHHLPKFKMQTRTQTMAGPLPPPDLRKYLVSKQRLINILAPLPCPGWIFLYIDVNAYTYIFSGT
jgi:hypothetical protein